MNAPWSPNRNGGPTGREPFAAYSCDDQSADVLRSVCTELGWQPEKVHKGGLRNAVQSLSVSASPMILFVDLSESGDPINDINSLAEVCEPGTVVVAAGEVNDVRLYRDLVASGIQDYLLKPLNIDQVRDAVNQAQAYLNAPKHQEVSTDRPHTTMAITGVRGGVGASTLATSLAWLYSTKLDRSTALLDLDVHFGTGALALDLEPGRGLSDAIENPSRIDGLFIERAMVRANEKLAVLSSEAPINQPLYTDGTAYYQLMEEMKIAFENTVIDLPRAMLVQYPHLVNDLQAMVLVTELTLAGARDTIRLVSWMKSNAPQCQLLVVANRSGANGMQEITQKDFEGSIERSLDFVLPYDTKTSAQAAKLGKPLAEVAKGGKLGTSLHEIASLLLNASTDDDDSSGKTKSGKQSLASKFAGFKSLLPSKGKAKDAKQHTAA
jgi:pilus assembly protein CpaE